MKKKKALTVLLSMVMAASILCGCGERQETMGSAEGTRQEGNKESKETTDREKESATATPKEDKEPQETSKPEESQKTKTVTLLTKRLKPDGYSYEYEYDAAGNMSKVIHHDSSDEKESWCEFEYDAAGNMSKRIDYSFGGKKRTPFEFEYDANGNMTKRIQYYENGETIYEVKEYITITLE